MTHVIHPLVLEPETPLPTFPQGRMARTYSNAVPHSDPSRMRQLHCWWQSGTGVGHDPLQWGNHINLRYIHIIRSLRFKLRKSTPGFGTLAWQICWRELREGQWGHQVRGFLDKRDGPNSGPSTHHMIQRFLRSSHVSSFL